MIVTLVCPQCSRWDPQHVDGIGRVYCRCGWTGSALDLKQHAARGAQ